MPYDPYEVIYAIHAKEAFQKSPHMLSAQMDFHVKNVTGYSYQDDTGSLREPLPIPSLHK